MTANRIWTRSLKDFTHVQHKKMVWKMPWMPFVEINMCNITVYVCENEIVAVHGESACLLKRKNEKWETVRMRK